MFGVKSVLNRVMGFPIGTKQKFPLTELVEVKIRNIYDKYSVFSSKVIVLMIVRIGGTSEVILTKIKGKLTKIFIAINIKCNKCGNVNIYHWTRHQKQNNNNIG